MERLASLRRTAAAVAVTVTAAIAMTAGTAAAHDGIKSSNPPSRATLQEPISTVDIDFGASISDDVEMFLTYDLGDNEFEELGGTTVKTGDTTARLDFDELTREGTYFVRYLAPVPLDGHVLAGAVSFTYGSPSIGQSDGFPVLPFALAAIVVIAIGGWFSYRRMQTPDGDDVAATDGASLTDR